LHHQWSTVSLPRAREPYRHKATVLRIVKTLPHKRIMLWGFGYAVSAADSKAYNKRTTALHPKGTR